MAKKIFKVCCILLIFISVNITFAQKSVPEKPSAEIPFGERAPVKIFIRQMVKKHKFVTKELVKLFDQVKIREKVIHHFQAPLEDNPWYRYQMLFITEWRIREGVKFWNHYKTTLARAEKIYGVPASIIVATIGIETKYGKSTGGYRVIDALTNIAFSASKRAAFFKSELEQFLLLTREKHLDPLKVMGSYAGAIGQPQFMPSSYRAYAVDFSGDNKMDLSHNEEDVIGSIANYYHEHGWDTHMPVVVPAIVRGYRFQTLLEQQKPITVNNLTEYGIVPRMEISGNPTMNLLAFKGYFRDEYWLSFHNFEVIKRYNRSPLYAMAVYQLSEYISSLKGKLADE